MSVVMEIFKEYCPQSKDAKVSFSVDMRDWFWFKILVFTNKKINLIKELEILAKHKGNRYEEFSVCLEEFFIRLNNLLVLFQGEKNLKLCLLTFW